MIPNRSNSNKTHRGRGGLHRNTVTVRIDLGIYLLAFFITLSAGRVDYRGRPLTPHTSLRGPRVEYGSTHRLRRLEEAVGYGSTASPTATPTRGTPTCASVYVPQVAGNLTGIYTHMGRYSAQRPVYINPDNGNYLFAQTAASSHTTTTTWYLTQSDSSCTFFLSVEADVFEPIELTGNEPWVRNNDATCRRSGGSACTTWMLLSCDTLTADLLSTPTPSDATPFPNNRNEPGVGDSSTYSTINGTDFAYTVTPAQAPLSNKAFSAGNATVFTASPTPSPTASSTVSPTPSPTVPGDLTPVTESTTTSTSITSITNETHSIGCMTLEVTEGGARTGVYLMSSPDSPNSRPGYVVSGGYRKDEIYSKKVSICAPGWGAVNSTWADATGELPATASLRDVWLMYAAGLDLDMNGGGCSVDVWFITEGGIENLSEAGGDTFLAVSDADDPSGVTQWVRLTPEMETERSTLEDDSWIGVSCADG